jgi:hypothetical protein
MLPYPRSLTDMAHSKPFVILSPKSSVILSSTDDFHPERP